MTPWRVSFKIQTVSLPSDSECIYWNSKPFTHTSNRVIKWAGATSLKFGKATNPSQPKNYFQAEKKTRSTRRAQTSASTTLETRNTPPKPLKMKKIFLCSNCRSEHPQIWPVVPCIICELSRNFKPKSVHTFFRHVVQRQTDMHTIQWRWSLNRFFCCDVIIHVNKCY